MAAATTTTTAYALNIGAIGIVGTFLGMPIESMLLGAIAGALVHGLRQTNGRIKGVSTLITSALLAGAFTPAAVDWLAAFLNLNGESLKPFVAVFIGGAWQWAVPLLADAAKRGLNNLVDKYSGGNK